MERWTDGHEDARIVEDKGTNGSKQLAGISPETNEPAQHGSNAGGTWGGKSSQLLLLHKDALCNEWLRKSTVQQNQVSTTQIKHFSYKAWPTMNPQPHQSKDTIWFPMKAAVHAPVMSVITQNKIKLPNVSLPLNDHWLYKKTLSPYY